MEEEEEGEDTFWVEEEEGEDTFWEEEEGEDTF